MFECRVNARGSSGPIGNLVEFTDMDFWAQNLTL